MSKKLDTITSTYFSFAEDQLLSHTDLNRVIDYFEDQDRLSRICLNGVGIVCGFKPTWSTDEGILYISQGTGVTTDGDLVQFLFGDPNSQGVVDKTVNLPGLTKNTDFLKLSKHRPFNDSDANYEQFQTGLGQIALTELLPSTEVASDIPDLAFFNNKTILIYLDCYSNAPGACTTVTCDSQGIEQVRVVRVLLVNDGDLNVVNKHDYLFNAGNIAVDFLNQNPVAVPRVVINDSNTTSITSLSDAYENAVLAPSDMLDNLVTNIGIIGSRVGFDTSSLTTNITAAFTATTFGNTLFQYRYDLFKDLVDCYSELRELFVASFPSCCPDIYPFPKHLLVGTLNSATTSEITTGQVEGLWEENNVNRHKFYPSPIITDHCSSREHIRATLGRMILMVDRYDVQTATSTDEVRITPSNMLEPLAKRAIPFYYDPQYDVNSNSTLVRIWDFKRRTLRQYDQILGYNQADESSDPIVIEPLKYNLDSYDFFRIEGHKGLLYQDALERVNQIRDQYALGFDTKVLGVAVDASQTINIDDYTCDFLDLQGQLDTCIDTQNCLFEFASQLLSGYSIVPDDEGFNHNTNDLMGRQRIWVVNPTLTFPTIPGSSKSTSTSTPLKTPSNIAKQPAANSVMYLGALQLQQNLALAGPLNLADFDNPIIQNLYTDGGSQTGELDGLGLIMLDAFQRFIGTDSEATYGYIDGQLDILTGPGGLLDGWDNTVIQANLYLPAKVLSSAYAVSLLIPETLQGLTPELIENYKQEVGRMCTYVRQYKAAYESLRTAQNTSISNDLYALAELLANNMASLCCAGDKLESIMNQMDQRKIEILTGLELAKFAQEHPGMEHMAGVPKGGTFILAYAYDESTEGVVQNGTVIADFALPYLCCSDCSSVNFIVPSVDISLLLSDSTVCIDTTSLDTITVDVYPTPSDGVVGIKGEISGVSIAGNRITIQQNSFSPSDFNTPIEFTVNGQDVTATLMPLEKATVGITVSPAPASDIFSYVFYATGYGSDDRLIWDFGDGTTAEGPIVSHDYILPIPPTNDPVVTLTVIPANGACPATATVNFSFMDVTVSLDQTDFCVGDSPYPFTIAPPSAQPNITGPGVTPDQKFFDPRLTPGAGNYQLSSEGVVFETANVFDKPSVKILAEADNVNSQLVLNSETERIDADSLRWAFFDPESPEVELQVPAPVQITPNITVPYSDFGPAGTRRIVRLTANGTSPSPCDSAIDEVIFTVPQ